MNTPMISPAVILLTLLTFFTSNMVISANMNSSSTSTSSQLKYATFAGGCFWCMQPPFDQLDGVISTTVGYSGGVKENPSYKEVSAGLTNHTETIQIQYDPAIISYQALLDVFWMNIDPTTLNSQFVDHGKQYRTSIFYHDESQKKLAEASKAALSKSGRYEKPIVTEIVALTAYYSAEEYHQKYYEKNPIRYKFYRYNSGRDQYLDKKWGEKK